jgi:antibiotic biosynthesis monooxygenase (ABM) superfamily enzyme
MPPRWKMVVVVWLAIYPSITFLLWLAGPKMASWPLPLRTLAITAVVVPLMVFVLLPAIQRLLAPWSRPVGYANSVRVDELAEFTGEIEFSHPTGATSSASFFSPGSGDARPA